MESALAVAFPPLHPLCRGTTDPGITLSAATYRRRRDQIDRLTRPQSSLLSMRPIESHLDSVWHLRIAVTLGPITDGRVVLSFRPRRFFWRPSEVPRALSMRCSNSSHNLRTRKKEKRSSSPITTQYHRRLITGDILFRAFFASCPLDDICRSIK